MANSDPVKLYRVRIMRIRIWNTVGRGNGGEEGARVEGGVGMIFKALGRG